MSHLKRLRAPRTWNIDRKARVFVVRPRPGRHPLRRSLPLLAILRDMLRKAHSAREAEKILRSRAILVDGAVARDPHQAVGLFDVVSIPSLDEHYRILFDRKGHLQPSPIPAGERMVKVCRVLRKRIIRGGKTQVTLHDGRTLLTDHAVRVGDSAVLSLPDGTLTTILPLSPNAPISVIGGKRSGSRGILRQITGSHAVYEDAQHTSVETLKAHILAVGEIGGLPLVTVEHPPSPRP